MTIVHRTDRSSESTPTPAQRTETPRDAPSRGKVELGPQRPAWSSRAKHEARGQTWVQFTLLVVVGTLFWFALSVPRPRTTRAAIEAERAFVELRLTLAELRAVISDYRADHGVFPGSAADDAHDPHWFEHEWQKAIERNTRANAAENEARLPDPYDPGGLPPNPINALASVRILSFLDPWPAGPDGSTGWIYQPATGEIRANCLGKAFGSRIPYWDL